MALAEDLDIDRGGDSAGSGGGSGGGSDDVGSDGVDEAFELIVGVLLAAPVEEALARGARYQDRLLAVEAELLARRKKAGASDRSNEDLLGRGAKKTKGEAKKRARRGAAVNNNPSLGGDLADGGLTVEQVDAIAEASDKTGGAAAQDEDLIARVKAANPDDAKRIVAEWLDDRTTNDQREIRRQHQRRLRRTVKYRSSRGTVAILSEGDNESTAEMWAVIDALADRLYRNDGGRDLPAGSHWRTRDQRRFDALHQLITGTTPTNTDTDADSDSGSDSASGGRSGKSAKKAATVGGFTPTVHVHLIIDDIISGDLRARLASGESLPESVTRRYLHHAAVAGTMFGTVFDGDGEILWHSRNKRYATPAQTRALIARDRHCTLCGAPPTACAAHHLIPYNSPGRGETDTHQLALVCDDCHHHIHTNNLTLHHTPNNNGRWQWHLRPATPNETPPQRPPPEPPPPTTNTRPDNNNNNNNTTTHNSTGTTTTGSPYQPGTLW